MAFTFMKAMGKNIGGSLLEESMIPVALELINKARMKNVNLVLPVDVIFGSERHKVKMLSKALKDFFKSKKSF